MKTLLQEVAFMATGKLLFAIKDVIIKEMNAGPVFLDHIPAKTFENALTRFLNFSLYPPLSELR